jgi:hypothetical protein
LADLGHLAREARGNTKARDAAELAVGLEELTEEIPEVGSTETAPEPVVGR